MPLDKDAIISIAATNAIYLCMRWLPNGMLQSKKEWVALNPTRHDRTLGSFKVAVGGPRAGYWADFSDKSSGKNMITLYCYLHKLDPSDSEGYKTALHATAKALGVYDEI